MWAREEKDDRLNRLRARLESLTVERCKKKTGPEKRKFPYDSFLIY